MIPVRGTVLKFTQKQNMDCFILTFYSTWNVNNRMLQCIFFILNQEICKFLSPLKVEVSFIRKLYYTYIL